jgi:hypothetical protein
VAVHLPSESPTRRATLASLPIEIRDSPVWTQAQDLRGVCGLSIRIASAGLLNVCSHPNAEQLALTREGPFRKVAIGVALFGSALFWANYVVDLIRGEPFIHTSALSSLVCAGSFLGAAIALYLDLRASRSAAA